MDNNRFEYLYNEMKIVFAKSRNEDEVVYINATQMAKVFGKKPDDYLRTKSTKEFIEAISASHKCEPTDLVIVRNGGDNFGTWMHQDVALNFAQWLDVNFGIWCNDRLKEIFKFGFTGTREKLEELILSPEMVKGLAEQVIKYRDEAEMYKAKVDEQIPKVEYYDNVLNTSNTFNVNVIAKELGMTAQSLNKFLHENNIQYKSGGLWLLYKKYQDLDYAKVETTIVDNRSYHRLKWTEKGREFIHNLIKTNK